MVIGANPTVGHPVFASQMKKRIREGAKLIVVDPRKTDIVKSPHIKADYHLPILPGSNVPVQEMEGYISNDAISELALAFNYSNAEVLDVLTYYDDFTLEPSGKHVIRVCRAEACQSLKSKELTEHLTDHFGMSLGETTNDSKITLKYP